MHCGTDRARPEGSSSWPLGPPAASRLRPSAVNGSGCSAVSLITGSVRRRVRRAPCRCPYGGEAAGPAPSSVWKTISPPHAANRQRTRSGLRSQPGLPRAITPVARRDPLTAAPYPLGLLPVRRAPPLGDSPDHGDAHPRVVESPKGAMSTRRDPADVVDVTAVELEPTSPEPIGRHDHAWRRVSGSTTFTLGEYRCQDCGAIWTL